jgi:putative effector of murein hydrolase LrgA (UPF0299 family)
MTGLQLNQDTSWGVSNVMEFYINFGVPGLVVGFLLFGWLLGAVDLRAAAAERRGDFKSLIVFFLPAVAMIDPNGSVVEITGGASAALLAAFVWRWAWGIWQSRESARPVPGRLQHPGPGPAV